MPMVSVITASSADPSREAFWGALATSVNCQQGVEVEWLVAAPEGAATARMLGRLEALLTEPSVTLRHVPVLPASSVGARRNAALKRAEGDYVTSLDDDDVLAGPGSLSRRVAALEESGAMWSMGQFLDFWGDRSVSWSGQLPAGMYEFPRDTELLLPEGFPASAHTSTVLAETSVVRDVGGWHQTLRAAEDLDLLYRLVAAGGAAVMIPETVLLYRKHGASIMAKIDRLEDRQVIRSLRQRYDLPPLAA